MKHAEGFTCWELLDLAPTVDEHAVKSAYARALREAGGPEVMDPDDFQMLREAYQKCLTESNARRIRDFFASLFGFAGFGGLNSGIFDDTFSTFRQSRRCVQCLGLLVTTHDALVCTQCGRCWNS